MAQMSILCSGPTPLAGPGKTLVIGANSQLGQMLLTLWSAAPDILWVSRSRTPHQWALDDGSAALTQHLQDVDVIICLAGATPGSGVDYSLNVDIAAAVIAAAAQAAHPIQVFLASSMAVYGTGPGPHAEDADTLAEHDYGQSKLRMEQVARDLARASGVQVCCLRLGNVVGADMVFRNVAAGTDITLDQFADGGTPCRSYIDPVALALTLDKLVARARTGQTLPDLLNVASDPPLEMAALLRAAGIGYALRPAPDQARQMIAMDMRQVQALVTDLVTLRDANTAISAWRLSTRPILRSILFPVSTFR